MSKSTDETRRLQWLTRACAISIAALGCGRSPEPTSTIERPLLGANVLLPVRDTSVRDDNVNKNFGSDPTLPIAQALVAFDQGALLALVPQGQRVASARLEVTMTGNPLKAGSSNSIDANRLVHSWSETAATWNCAADTNVSNTKMDCAAA